jgi:hypothetical protein
MLEVVYDLKGFQSGWKSQRIFPNKDVCEVGPVIGSGLKNIFVQRGSQNVK